MTSRVRAAAAHLCLALLAPTLHGCDAGPTESFPAAPLAVAVSGARERGMEVELRLLRDGVSLPPEGVQWTVAPAGAAQWTGAGTARLRSAGEITFTARAGDRTASLTVVAAAPPSVVFDRAVGGNRDLWRVALDGGELTRLTSGPGEELDPSAVGGTIVFVSYRGGNADLYALGPDGVERQLTATREDETSPSLSRDQRRVAYTSDRTGVPRLWTLSLDGSSARAAVPGFASATEFHAGPSWAPGPDLLGFVSTSAGRADILRIAPGTGSPQPLAAGSAAEVEPAWSPDGGRLAFVSDRDGDTEIYLLTVASGAVTRLTRRPGVDAQPAWLPDGRLVYTAFSAGTSTLRWMDPASPERTYEVPTGGPGASRPSGIL